MSHPEILTTARARALYAEEKQKWLGDNPAPYGGIEALNQRMTKALLSNKHDPDQRAALLALRIDLIGAQAEQVPSGDFSRMNPSQLTAAHEAALADAQAALSAAEQTKDRVMIEQARAQLHGLENVERARQGQPAVAYFSDDEEGERLRQKHKAAGEREVLTLKPDADHVDRLPTAGGSD